MKALYGGLLAACLLATPSTAQASGGLEEELRDILIGEWSLSENACGSWRVVFTQTGTTETLSIDDNGWMSGGVGTFAIDGMTVTILRATTSQVFAVKYIESDHLIVTEASGPATDLIRCNWATRGDVGPLPYPGALGL